MKVALFGSSMALALLMAAPAMAEEATDSTAITNTSSDTAASSTGTEDSNKMSLIGPDAEQLPALDADAIYSGWRAEALLDADVYGPTGDELGEIEDLIIGQDGKIVAAVVEGGGFLEIGDARFRIPWDQVTARPGEDSVQVPLTEETAENFGLYDGPDWVATGPREFRLSELLGDRVALRNGVSAGYVDDVVFTEGGQLAAVLINSGYGRRYGMYAYPWYGYGYGYGWDPGLSYYALPVTNIDELPAGGTQIEVNRFDKKVPFRTAG